MVNEDWRAMNLANWESRVPHHAAGYDLEAFRADPSHLSEVVRFDLPRLGDVRGLRTVHLQCHLGTDTLSLARLGAVVTGLDFSPSALAVARGLADECGIEAEWVESDVYGARQALRGEFDLVYTGVGALCWLPDVATWASVVASLLRPGGSLFIREGHPMLWALCDPRPDGLVTLEYPYFETAGTEFVEPLSYVPHVEPLASPRTVQFNHSISQILNAVWRAGLEITLFEEHQTVPWNQLGDVMVDVGGGEFRLRDAPERLAASYTLRAAKPMPDRLGA